jgi:hypothetical protein
MPCETHRLEFKPVDFFTESPSADLPASTQAANKSTLVSTDTNGQPNGHHGADGSNGTNGCCE